MKMPGFTANAAVYDSRVTTYGMTGAVDAPAQGAVVVPQVCQSIGPCRICVNIRFLPPGVCVSLSCFGRQLINRCVP